MGESLTMEIKHMIKCSNGSIDIKIKKNGQYQYCSLVSKQVIGKDGKMLRKGVYDFSSFLSILSESEKQELFEKVKEEFKDVKTIEDST